MLFMRATAHALSCDNLCDWWQLVTLGLCNKQNFRQLKCARVLSTPLPCCVGCALRGCGFGCRPLPAGQHNAGLYAIEVAWQVILR